MSDFVQGSGPPWTHIVNDNSNYNYNYNPGGNITNLNNNSVHNYVVAPEVTPDALVIIEKALGQHHLPSATFEAQPASAGCMQGTRVEFLKQVMALLISRTGPHIAWIAGMAGTGKTSIALSLCRLLWENADVFLGGTFFCSRSTGTVERTDVRRIIPTLATVFAREYPAYASALARQLAEKPDVAHWSVQSQVERLLTLPLAELGRRDGQIVFVIDALDECSDQGKMAELLNTLADFKSAFPVKFLLTSRPEMYIRKTHISNPSLSSTLQLHTVNPAHVAADIRLYIETVLMRASGMTAWYAECDVEMLVRHSDGLFIFASTVLKYILDPFHDEGRRERLQKAVSAVSRGTVLTAPLDQIYELVLIEASRPNKVEADELANTKRVLACILTTRSSLSLGALADLLEVNPASLRVALDRLHSLVHVPDSDAEPGVRTLHASLGDYMFDRSPDHIRISTASGHDILASGCIRRMARDDLCFNISRSQSSFNPNPDVDLDWIPLSLLYACFQWAHHLDAASSTSAWDEEIGRMLLQKFLFWLEVLSIAGRMSMASGLLRIAGSAVKLHSVAQFLRDANSFVASSYDPLARSAPHIYLSALPFAAKDSLIWQHFGSRSTGVVAVETFGTDRHGGRVVMTLTRDEEAVRYIAYSRDGRLIASSSDRGTVRVWDTRTGEEIMTPIFVDKIEAIGFILGDVGVAVISSIGELRTRNFSTGRELLHTLQNGTGRFCPAAFSPDGALVASTSGPTVSLWKNETGEQVFTFKIDINDDSNVPIHKIMFSSDGRLFAASVCTKDGQCSIYRWETLTGHASGSPLDVGRSNPLSFSISLDGHALSARLLNGATQVWHLKAPSRAPTVLNIGDKDLSYNWPSSRNYKLQFSPNGSCLAAAEDSIIHVFHLDTKGEADAPLRGHLGSINSISFSPDGLYIASASDDGTIRIWDVGSKQAVIQPLPEPSGVKCVTASPNGALIISGHADGSVRAWDGLTGQVISERLRGIRGHECAVVSVAISSDGRLIASGSETRSEGRDHEPQKDIVFRLANLETGVTAGELSADLVGDVLEVTFSPDTSRLAFISCKSWDRMELNVWNITTRAHSVLGELGRWDNWGTIAFSSDGRLLAAGVDSGWFRVWVVQTGQPLCAPLHISRSTIPSLEFSQDGTQIVTATRDGIFHVWDVIDGHLVPFNADKADDNHSSQEDMSDEDMSENSGEDYMSSDDASDTTLDIYPNLLAHSLSGRLTAHIKEGAMRLWDVAAPDVVAIARLPNYEHVEVSPDKQSLISCDGVDVISVWRIESVFSLGSVLQCDPLSQLLRQSLRGEWTNGPSGELVLWVPADYQQYLQIPPCTLLIAKARVVITADPNGGMCVHVQ